MSTSRWSGAAALLLVLGAACRDAGTGPSATALSLEIRRSATPVEEETIAIGGELQLSATVFEATGKAVEPAMKAQWSSSNAQVATVDTTGLVRGVSVGTALVIARASSYADTVRINVAELVTSALACEPGAAAIRLQPGQAFTTSGEKAVTLCLESGATAPAAAEYLMVPFNASSAADAQLAVELNATGTRSATGPPTPYLGAAPSSARIAPYRDGEAHALWRERSSAALESRLRAGGSLVPVGAALAAQIPAVGDLLKLNVETKSGNGCTDPDYRHGRVVATSARAIVVADTANPRGQRPDQVLTQRDYEHFAATFDTLVWRVDTQNFGEPTDIDENKRVIIFFTRAVNELTQPESRSYVAGFFFNRDLFRRTGTNACAGSNAGEMFYIMVPDPQGEVNRNVRSRDFVLSSTVGVLAHEFQHLINDSRRLYVVRAPVWETTWLNEGLSHIAEELVFYAAAGLAPRSNLGAEQMANPRVLDAFDRYNSDNVERLIEYLQRPENESLMGRDELPTRGASWAFLRYAADRSPGDDAPFWKDLVSSKTQGLANLDRVLGTSARGWMQDWTVSVYTDDAVAGVEERFQQPSWNFRTLIPGMRDSFRISRNDFPLRTLSLTRRTLPLKGGGAAYLRFGVTGGQTAAIRATVAGLPAPSRLKLSIVRIR